MSEAVQAEAGAERGYRHFWWTGDAADAPDWLRPRLRQHAGTWEFRAYRANWVPCRRGMIFMVAQRRHATSGRHISALYYPDLDHA